jgi:hypothetical protein
MHDQKEFLHGNGAETLIRVPRVATARLLSMTSKEGLQFLAEVWLQWDGHWEEWIIPILPTMRPICFIMC